MCKCHTSIHATEPKTTQENHSGQIIGEKRTVWRKKHQRGCQHTDIAGRLDLLDLVPDPTECDGSSQVRVTFVPQTWHKGRLVPAEKREHFVVPAEDATDENGSLYDDGSCKAKQLCAHDNAPERAREWEGPFTIVLDWV